MSILSERQDAYGFHYGFLEGDHRQINVRKEGGYWVAYVGGDKVASQCGTKDQAETAAIEWITGQPRASRGG